VGGADVIRKYLSDPTEDVRVATEHLLADFLREVRHVTNVRKKIEERAKAKQAESGDADHEDESEEGQTAAIATESTANSVHDTEVASEIDFRDLGCKPFVHV
jgi:vacuole morphology and inheritance protein 14